MVPQDHAGGESLDALLEASGSPLRTDEVHALLRGLCAAPVTGTAGDEASWLSLIATSPSPALTRRLRELRDEIADTIVLATAREAVEGRVTALRAEMGRLGLSGFIVPRADEHQGEYVPLCSQRLAWLTGFSGSAGTAIVLTDKAAIFVDGRYTLQVRSEIPAGLIDPLHSSETPPHRWIASQLPKGGVLGYDPRLHTEAEVNRLRSACERAGGSLRACANLVDAIWTDRPPAPLAPVVPHPVEYAGREARDKRMRLAETLREDRLDAAVLTAPDSIAWLLNLRGGDVPHTPLPLSFATLHDDGTVHLFIDGRKLTPSAVEQLGNGVTVRPPGDLDEALTQLGRESRRVLIDEHGTSAAIVDRLGEAGVTVVRGEDPCLLPKARKNPTEIEGARAAHARDAIAVTRFLAWIAASAPGSISELDAEARLLAFRRELPLFRDLSFPTISGAGPNGAIVHYRSSEASNRKLEAGSLYLVDSGAQFLDGTTDITRTVAIGTPNADQRHAFTRVLKGHIALATVRFPKGTTGSQLDVLARMHLWAAGLDFDHGTGHGIGSYLSVHEGPQRISKAPSTVALEPGMILSNEPGYYRTGAWGIRTENLLLVERAQDLPNAEREMFGFEVLTLAPIDRSLIELALLTEPERRWIDAYHARVCGALSPSLDEDSVRWLKEATAPLS